ncbi:MAG TPA: NUDIX domain-containing protein [Vicinamibacterales bacterium]|nr:NUDIX domain-containing protein [Vicinamibacterales bacterium]
MAKTSAGLLMFRRGTTGLEILLVHPGGPFWAKKDDGAWSIPKGEIGESEDALAAARREVAEETGAAPDGNFIPLTPVRQAGGKVVHAWAIESDFDTSSLTSNTFRMEWPPRSGHQQTFPEVDRAAWFAPGEARQKILRGQRPLIDELARAFPHV